MMKLGIFFLIIVMNIVAHPVCAQDVAVKTNILSDVFLNINTSLEVGLAPRWTLDISGEVMIAGGSIGQCNLKLVIGFATVLRGILSEPICTADNII